MSSYNEKIIAEFRQNGGRVTGPHEGVDMLLLTTTGRRSGLQRVSPLAYAHDAGRYVIAASNGGTDDDPSWLHNLRADPHVTVELGDRVIEATATIADSDERDRLWSAHVAAMPAFAAYETTTDRVIPMVILEQRDAAAA